MVKVVGCRKEGCRDDQPARFRAMPGGSLRPNCAAISSTALTRLGAQSVVAYLGGELIDGDQDPTSVRSPSVTGPVTVFGSGITWVKSIFTGISTQSCSSGWSGSGMHHWKLPMSPPSAELAACSSRSYDREEGQMRSCDVDRVGRAARRFMHLHFAGPGLDHQRAGHRSSKTVPIPAPPWRGKAGWAVWRVQRVHHGRGRIGDDAAEVVGDPRCAIPPRRGSDNLPCQRRAMRLCRTGGYLRTGRQPARVTECDSVPSGTPRGAAECASAKYCDRRCGSCARIAPGSARERAGVPWRCAGLGVMEHPVSALATRRCRGQRAPRRRVTSGEGQPQGAAQRRAWSSVLERAHLDRVVPGGRVSGRELDRLLTASSSGAGRPSAPTKSRYFI